MKTSVYFPILYYFQQLSFGSAELTEQYAKMLEVETSDFGLIIWFDEILFLFGMLRFQSSHGKCREIIGAGTTLAEENHAIVTKGLVSSGVSTMQSRLCNCDRTQALLEIPSNVPWTVCQIIIPLFLGTPPNTGVFLLNL